MCTNEMQTEPRNRFGTVPLPIKMYSVCVCKIAQSVPTHEINSKSNLERLEPLLISLLQRGTSGLLGRLKMVFRGFFFTSKLPLNPILTSSLT